jgi:hypothetical protein
LPQIVHVDGSVALKGPAASCAEQLRILAILVRKIVQEMRGRATQKVADAAEVRVQKPSTGFDAAVE